ncbi:hypothetical protein D3C86_1724280 [compost metagenome]
MMDAVNVQTWIIGGEPHRHFVGHRGAICSGNNELRGVLCSFGAQRNRQFDFPIGLGNGIQAIGVVCREIREWDAQSVRFLLIP